MAIAGASAGRSPARPKAENDIYTALIVVAFLFVLAATLYVSIRAITLFGGLWPPPGG